MSSLQVTLQREKTTQLALQEAEQALEGFSTWAHYHMMIAWTASVADFDSTELEHHPTDSHSWNGQGRGRFGASRLALATLDLGQVT